MNEPLRPGGNYSSDKAAEGQASYEGERGNTRRGAGELVSDVLTDCEEGKDADRDGARRPEGPGSLDRKVPEVSVPADESHGSHRSEPGT